jgi:hypothetical protein
MVSPSQSVLHVRCAFERNCIRRSASCREYSAIKNTPCVALRRSVAALLAILVLSIQPGQPIFAQTKATPSKDTSKTPPANQTRYTPNDAIAQQAQAMEFTSTLSPFPLTWGGCDKLADAQTVFDTFILSHSNGQCLLDLIATSLKSAGNSTLPDGTDVLGKGNAIILHAAEWSGSPKYQPTRAAWAFFRVRSDGNLTETDDSTGTPYFYKASHVYLVDLNLFSSHFDKTKVSLDYSITTSARQKQNQSDAATLLSSVLKITGTAPGGAAGTPEV